jgi:hypothetical protein
MAANITVGCPVCGREFGLRFDPGPEDAARRPFSERRTGGSESSRHAGSNSGIKLPEPLSRLR